jgi:hypothetical protein
VKLSKGHTCKRLSKRTRTGLALACISAAETVGRLGEADGLTWDLGGVVEGGVASPSAPSLCLSPPGPPFSPLRGARHAAARRGRAAASISLRPSSLLSSQRGRGRGGGDGQRGRARRDPPPRAPLPRYVPFFSFPDPSTSAEWREASSVIQSPRSIPDLAGRFA